MPPGFNGSPGIDSSSPVKNTATRTRRNTGSVASPTEAARPMSCGRRRVPAARISAPARMSSPARRMFSPASRHMVDLHHALAGMLAQLLHHHRVGPFRQRRAGEDARRRAGGERRADAAGGDALRHRQARAGRRHVGRAHGVAVHGRVVERRHGRCRSTARAPGRGRRRNGVDLLDLRPGGRGEELVQGFVEGKQAHLSLRSSSR
jgi:hypothetical protein